MVINDELSAMSKEQGLRIKGERFEVKGSRNERPV